MNEVVHILERLFATIWKSSTSQGRDIIDIFSGGLTTPFALWIIVFFKTASNRNCVYSRKEIYWHWYFLLSFEQCNNKYGHFVSCWQVCTPGHYSWNTKATVLFAVKRSDLRFDIDVDGSINLPQQYLMLLQ